MNIIEFFKNYFGKKEVDNTSYIESITCGERDEHGFCDTYVNGVKTNVRMLVFTEEEVSRLHEVQRDMTKELTTCQAGTDGECYHPMCPQNRDGEPMKSGRFCPLPHWTDDENY